MFNNRNLVYMELFFENTDSICINAEDIDLLYIPEIHHGIFKFPQHYVAGPEKTKVHRADFSNDVRFRLLPSANKTHNEFGMKGSNNEVMVFNRIKLNDIVSIGLVYEQPDIFHTCKDYTDEDSDIIEVCWNEDNEFVNKYQVTTEGNDCLEVRIKKTECEK